VRESSHLKAVEIADNLGAGPLLGAHELAANDSLAVNDIGFRPHIRVKEIRRRLRGIADSDQVDVMANDKGRVGGGIVVDADGKNDEIGILMMKREERRQFLDARRAPAGPEVEQDNLAAIAGQVNG
jgi:hypothetical protein